MIRIHRIVIPVAEMPTRTTEELVALDLSSVTFPPAFRVRHVFARITDDTGVVSPTGIGLLIGEDRGGTPPATLAAVSNYVTLVPAAGQWSWDGGRPYNPSTGNPIEGGYVAPVIDARTHTVWAVLQAKGDWDDDTGSVRPPGEVWLDLEEVELVRPEPATVDVFVRRLSDGYWWDAAGEAWEADRADAAPISVEMDDAQPGEGVYQGLITAAMRSEADKGYLVTATDPDTGEVVDVVQLVAVNDDLGAVTDAVTASEGVVTNAITASEGTITDAITASEGVVTSAIDLSGSGVIDVLVNEVHSAIGDAEINITNAVTGDAPATVIGAVTGAITASEETITDKIDALPSAAAIADAVLDEPLAGHTTTGTLADVLRRIIGLRHENVRVTYTSYVNDQPATGHVEVFASPEDLADGTSPIARYDFTQSFDGSGRQTEYTSAKTS